jgi:hypothetical protein
VDFRVKRAKRMGKELLSGRHCKCEGLKVTDKLSERNPGENSMGWSRGWGVRGRVE